MAEESKRDRFRRVVERRTSDILKKIRILGNCSNKTNYEYSENDIEKIFNTIEAELRDTRALFKKSKKDNDFKL